MIYVIELGREIQPQIQERQDLKDELRKAIHDYNECERKADEFESGSTSCAER